MTQSSAAAERVRRRALTYGGSLQGVWSAPGRVNLIGEHTDYNEGFVLPLAIAQRTAVALIPRDDQVIGVESALSPNKVERSLADFTRTGFEGWSAYPLGVVWALGEMGIDLASLPGADIVIDSDVPVGAGLSSSAAIECATALALRDFWGLDLTRPALARTCQRAENIAVGAPTGIMDQSVSLLAEGGHVLFLDCRSGETAHVGFDLAQDGLVLLVIDTRVRHSHATGEYASRRESCEEAARILGVPALRDATLAELDENIRRLDPVVYRRARHIITENDRVLQTVSCLSEDGPRGIGELLSASHKSMRDDFEISCPELDLAVSTALEGGALGARMTGGGFGGAAIALVDQEKVDEVSRGVLNSFGRVGHPHPSIFPVTPQHGATHHPS